MTAPVYLLQAVADVAPGDGWMTSAEREKLAGFLVPKRRGDWRLGRDLWTRKLRHTLQSDMDPAEIISRAWDRLRSEREEMLRIAETTKEGEMSALGAKGKEAVREWILKRFQKTVER